MNKFEFYKEFSNIDENFIVEADIQPKHKTPVLKYAVIAAGLLIILSTVTLSARNNRSIIQPSITMSSEEATESHNLFYNETDKTVGSLLKIPGHFWQELSDTEKRSIFGKLADKYTITATANFSKENESIQLFDIKANVKFKNDISINLTTSHKQIYNCYVLSKESIRTTEINGITVISGIYKTESSATQTFFAELNIDNVNYFAEMTSTKENEPYFSQFINELTLNKNANLTIIVPVAPELKDEKLTLEGAYADSVFGSYIPKSIPAEYKFESSRRFINQEYNYLSILWCCGLNDISFRVGYATDYDKKNITAVEEVKNYDLSLYPIPRGESVPEELWEIVQSPVFKAEELSEEVIAKRVTEHNEDGKAVKKINFSLIFDNDIVITVSTADLEPKEVYEMLIKTINNNR